MSNVFSSLIRDPRSCWPVLLLAGFSSRNSFVGEEIRSDAPDFSHPGRSLVQRDAHAPQVQAHLLGEDHLLGVLVALEAG